MVKSEILKEKVKRVVESKGDAKMEFLTVVASHDGSVMSDSVFTSFRRFKERYGEEKFEDVKDELIDEGIIFSPSYGSIQLTVRKEKGDYDYQKGKELSKFIGKLIFEHSSEMKIIIDKILKELEGKEFLMYICEKDGISTVNGREPEIKEIIGKRSYEKILKDLLEVGILTEYAWSSKKHGYHGYKILPSVDMYIKEKLSPFELSNVEKELKESGVSGADIHRCLEILKKIYIGQNIRSEGILKSDFSGFEKEIGILTKHGFIKDNNWYSFHLYLTTERGSKIGKTIIKNLIRNKRTEITGAVLNLPHNSIGFLLFDYMAASLIYSVGKEYPYDWREPLVADSRIWILRNKLLSKFEELGLCVKTRLCVSTRGGELRGEYYVTCEEVLDFLKDCTAYKGGLYGKEKKMSLLYDFFRKAKSFLQIEDINEVRERYYDEMEKLQLTEEEIGDIVNKMAKSKINSEYNGLLSDKIPFSIKDESRYDIYLREQLINPVIHFLLGKTKPKIDVTAEKVDEERLEEELRIEREKVKSSGLTSKKGRIEFYDKIGDFELELRQFIKEELKRKFGDSWLEDGVPKKIRENWDRIKRREEKEGIEPERDVINYALFSDYKEIIIHNWDEIFNRCFEDEGKLRVRLEDLNILGRIPVMHIRNINREKFGTAEHAVNWLRSKISNFRREQKETK